MNRFENSPDLFGRGAGQGTSGGIICDWCGKTYDADASGDTVGFTDFGGKQICDCCWAEIEQAVLSRMEDIIPWYGRILAARRKALEADAASLAALAASEKGGEG